MARTDVPAAATDIADPTPIAEGYASTQQRPADDAGRPTEPADPVAPSDETPAHDRERPPARIEGVRTPVGSGDVELSLRRRISAPVGAP